MIIEKLDNLEILYARITNLDNMDEQPITKTRVLLTGLVVGLLWKKKFVYTVIEYNDALLNRSVIEDCDGDEETSQRMIYARMSKAKYSLDNIQQGRLICIERKPACSLVPNPTGSSNAYYSYAYVIMYKSHSVLDIESFSHQW